MNFEKYKKIIQVLEDPKYQISSHEWWYNYALTYIKEENKMKNKTITYTLEDREDAIKLLQDLKAVLVKEVPNETKEPEDKNNGL